MTEDLIIVTDATGSMTTYMASLRTALPEILSMSQLSGVFQRIGVLAYRDYELPAEDQDLIEWSGFDTNLVDFTTRLACRTGYGGDWQEAAKTALSRVILDYVDPSRRTLIVFFADAPMHAATDEHPNAVKEREALAKTAYGSDWVQLSYEAQDRNCSVFSFIPDARYAAMNCFSFLSEVTGGRCLAVQNFSTLARLTLDVILQWNGLLDWSKAETKENASFHSSSKIYVYAHPLSERPSRYANELDASVYLTDSALVSKETLQLEDIPLGPLVAKNGRRNPAARFTDKNETAYRALVFELLLEQINKNVQSLTINPVFGQLWRSVAKDSTEENAEKKQGLFDAFSKAVGQISGATAKAAVQQWLEDSFDSSEEIHKIIDSAPLRNPRIYLDMDSDVKLTRREMLEVAKSCYPSVLKSLATIFTHLKIANEDSQLGADQRSIPLSLPPHDIFRLLPHLVVAGTLFPKRASNITSMLALITGVSFLEEPATKVLEKTKGTWLDLEVPENISFDAARFVLSAPEGAALNTEERTVYRNMRQYHLLQSNLRAPLEVEVPWTPEKARNVGDVKVVCTRCQKRRSVTIMSHEKHGVCAFCAMFEAKINEVGGEGYNSASEEETCWVECCGNDGKICKAHYVVEKVENLNVRAKCHYCRNNLDCPFVECSRCTNRLIVPLSYRPELQYNSATFLCPCCINPQRKSTEVLQLSIEQLRLANGLGWLGFERAPDLLVGKSAFKLAQAHGFGVFNRVTVEDAQLMFGGKKVLNADDVVRQVNLRLDSGAVDSGCCPLCFEDVPHKKLLSTCGRRGCKYAVDDACLRNWYGSNSEGQLLNLMQTLCPFCRRTPAQKIVRRYNPGVAALGGLGPALLDHAWYYAWCQSCGSAKRVYEKQCCQGDSLPDIKNFVCDDCSTRKTGTGYTICPNPECGIFVEKISGCNHITCVCGTHFCYLCGSKESEKTIYAHLSKEHGGYFDEEPDVYDVEDDEEDY